MTTPAVRPKHPPTTIVYRATPFAVFKTLLWAEFAPRRHVLGCIVALLTLYGLAQTSRTWYPSYSESDYMPFKGLDQNLAVAGVLYCVLGRGAAGLSTRQSWQAFALPVRRRWLIVPSLVFQFGVALLLALLWGFYRQMAGFEAPFSYPLALLTVLAVQGQTAMLWCGALGIARGIPVFGAGLGIATIAGIVAGRLTPLPVSASTATVLVVCSWIWSSVAAGFIRGKSFAVPDLFSIPGAARIRKWYLARAARKSDFLSAFRAQCWFEWNRTGRWFIALFGAAAFVTLLIDVPYILTRGESFFATGYETDSENWSRPTEYVYMFAPFLFWLLHGAVTRPYRRFVCTRPVSARSIAGSKLLVSVVAASGGILVLRLSNGCLNLLLPPGGVPIDATPLWGSILELVSSVATMYLSMTYGPFLMFVFIAFVGLERMAFPDPAGAGFLKPELSLILDSTFIFLLLLLFSVVRTSLKSNLELHGHPRPKEVMAIFAFLLALAFAACVERYYGSSTYCKAAFIYLGPVLLALATTRYGWRAKLIPIGLLCCTVTLYLLLFSSAALFGNQVVDIFGFVDGPTAGYWIVLFVCPIVFYPLIIDGQRREQPDNHPDTDPNWLLLILSPLLWVAFHLIGERFGDEKGTRS